MREGKLRRQRLLEKNVLDDIDKVALLTGEQLTKYYRNHRIFGLDIGVDRRGDIKMIEANKSPMMSHFRKLEDQSLYRRIKEYKKGW